ncbi:hypothetical protein GF412_00150 [Candidatus Micrarchaeota archaeon]|nr:hypothetical protein [Candidatus Micrarchaeota archaeon]MBD3417386.1 hypothetical protein [Candidatus Micrarchaeota archaeon]
MKRILLALVLFSLSFATCSIDMSDPEFQETYNTAMELVAIAVLFSVLVTALSYMVGKFTANANLILFSKDSLTQTIITVVMMVTLLGVFEGTCQFTTLFLEQPLNPLDSALNYAIELQVDGKIILKSLYSTSLDHKFAGSWMTGFYFPFIGGETGFRNTMHNAFSRQCEILMDLVNMGMVSAGVQYFVILMIRDFVFPIMIPFGLLLRALPFLREAGNVVLAIAFTLFIIFPFAYSVNSYASTIQVDAVDDEAVGLSHLSSGFGTIASYLFQTIFLPNLALVVAITGASAMVKAIKVIP